MHGASKMKWAAAIGAVLIVIAASLALRGKSFAAAAPASPNEVDVDLVLAIDASGSVEDDRFELQKRGFARAFRDPKVLDAIRAGDRQSIAVMMFQWTGPPLQENVVPWLVISDAVSADRVASIIEATPRRLMGGGTSISGAIDYAVKQLRTSPYPARMHVIDISGDGSNNRGRPVTFARDEAVAAGIGINGLPILALEPDLDRYYHDSVIGGPGAFVVAAQNYETFADAILKKLITEIALNDR